MLSNSRTPGSRSVSTAPTRPRYWCYPRARWSRYGGEAVCLARSRISNRSGCRRQVRNAPVTPGVFAIHLAGRCMCCRNPILHAPGRSRIAFHRRVPHPACEPRNRLDITPMCNALRPPRPAPQNVSRISLTAPVLRPRPGSTARKTPRRSAGSARNASVRNAPVHDLRAPRWRFASRKCADFGLRDHHYRWP